MNKKIIYESIMRTVAKHVKNALNEYRTAAPEHNIDIDDLSVYDLIINTDTFNPENVSEIIIQTLKVI
mgnify:CR=1 FL=1